MKKLNEFVNYLADGDLMDVLDDVDINLSCKLGEWIEQHNLTNGGKFSLSIDIDEKSELFLICEVDYSFEMAKIKTWHAEFRKRSRIHGKNYPLFQYRN